MDKVMFFQNIILDFMNDYVQKYGNTTQQIEIQVIADRDRNHFQLLEIGWHDHAFMCDAVFHFDIKNEKIWIQKNETEIEIGDEFLKRGIAKEDIVFGFLPEYMRSYVQFAA
jgi:XisI protein